MRWRRSVSPVLAGLLTLGATVPLGLPYVRDFGERRPAMVHTLVFVLHGDAPFTPPSYQYDFAAAATTLPGVHAVAILRPGYEDPDGDRSPGERGLTTGDNYTADRIDAIARAMAAEEARWPGAKHVIVGHSGGAAIAADLLAVRPALIDGALLVSCPCDLAAWRAAMKRRMPAAPFDRPVTSLDPLGLVSRIKGRPALTMVVGGDDDTAPPALTRRYAATARRRGLRVDVRVLPGRPHDILNEAPVLAALRDLLGRVTR